MTPAWVQHLTEADEWTVRTALANVAHDLDKVADTTDPSAEPGRTAVAVLRESATRYRDVLARIELADSE